MGNRKISIFLLLLFMIFSCNNVYSLDKNREVDLNLIEANKDGIYYVKGEETPYTGRAVAYFDNGQESDEENFIEGVHNGPFKEWFRNGQLKADWTMKDGKPDGECFGWYEDGQKAYERRYDVGVAQGRWAVWYESGRQKSEELFKDGSSNGKLFEYDNDGNVSNVVEFSRVPANMAR
ncbi:MAG: toxin-antitoxin system YwqK family antitoxin [Candidatus Omnitrophica bacterium]|nr:toxin-antitoxin system YwqK family antitoxin [Candidatus Omnitrophota bacterium]